ncbi:MAG: hypothetical protein UX67_C0022G0005, partial [Candidatus Woesebacteria bacterium GW2011_GWF2_46_8]
GDGKFNATVDVPLADSSGNVVVMNYIVEKGE